MSVIVYFIDSALEVYYNDKIMASMQKGVNTHRGEQHRFRAAR